MAGSPKPRPYGPSTRRHPAEVISDRLGDAVERWHEKFTGQERDEIAAIRHALSEIAEGER
jgi:hypothetical protein